MMYGRRPLTRLEGALYAVVGVVLIGTFANFALDYMEIAEKTAMQATLNNIASAVNVRYASGLVGGGPMDITDWVGRNPFDLARTVPQHYAGDLDFRDPTAIERPAWIFDAAKGELLYLPRLHRNLSVEAGVLRFKLVRHRSGAGFMLAPTSPYSW
jgi:hypothetical protein